MKRQTNRKTMLAMAALVLSCGASAAATWDPTCNISCNTDTIAPPPAVVPRLVEIIRIIDDNTGEAWPDAIVDRLCYKLDETLGTATVIHSDKVIPVNTSTIIIPESIRWMGKTYTVTTIGKRAFLTYSDASFVSMSNTIDSIAPSAFSGCTRLKSITLSQSLRAIGKYAFEGCEGLTSIDIPASVEHLEPNAFSGCTSLQDINVAPKNKRYCSKGGMLIDRENHTLLLCPNGKEGEVVIPETIQTIGTKAFSQCSHITGVRMAETLTHIGHMAFEDCSSLKSITLSNGLKEIGFEAFQGCCGIATVNIPESMEHIGWRAFASCTGLWEITVDPSNRKYCSSDGVLFNKGKSWLLCYPAGKEDTAYNIPSSVHTIDMCAFSGNIHMTEVTLPDAIRNITMGAFMESKALRKVNFGNSVSEIGYSVFSGCDTLESIYIPATVEKIDGAAFANCPNLRNIDIDRTNKAYCSVDGVLFDKQKRTLISFPGGWFRSHGTAAQKSRKSYKIPKKVTCIGEGAFRECSTLHSLVMPKTMQVIEEYAFSWCNNLHSVNIPIGMKKIGKDAFEGCYSMETITIPRSTEVEEGAFDMCEKLTIIRK